MMAHIGMNTVSVYFEASAVRQVMYIVEQVVKDVDVAARPSSAVRGGVI